MQNQVPAPRARPKGKAGEDYAAGVLKRQGYVILARNFSARFGELDIIAQKDGILAFVEVKTRRRGSMVSGFEAVTPGKMRKIILTAQRYMSAAPGVCDLQPRFDVFSVITENGTVTEHIHLEGAFDAHG